MKTELYTTEELKLISIETRKEIGRGYFVRANSWQLAEIREELAKRGESLEENTMNNQNLINWHKEREYNAMVIAHCTLDINAGSCNEHVLKMLREKKKHHETLNNILSWSPSPK